MNSTDNLIVIHEISKLRTPEQLWDPFDWYETMLENYPVYFDQEQKVWNVFRYDDVNLVLADWSIFSNRRQRSATPIPPVETRVNINSTDPPIQRDIRKLVSNAFTPRSLKDWEPRIESIVQEQIANMRESSNVDLVRDFAVPLPVTVIADLLGIPREDRHLIKSWSDILFFPNTTADENKQMRKKYAAMAEFHQYLFPFVREKRKQPENDIISDLTVAEYEGEKLTDEEIVHFSLGLLAAGNETTTNLISNMFYIFLYDSPGIYDEICSDLSLIPNAVEESLRFRFPITIDRVLTQDTDVLGVPMKKGETILTWLGAANHDPRQFPNPGKFDIHRDNSSKHLAFGKGPHFCLGAPLARLEGQLALRGFINAFSGIFPSPSFDIATHLHAGTQNLASLPVELEIRDVRLKD